VFSDRFAPGPEHHDPFSGKAFGRRATQYLEALGVLATLFCFTVVT
jgi:hypothetical protein